MRDSKFQESESSPNNITGFTDTRGGAQKPSRRPDDPHSSPDARGKAPPGGWKERSLSCNVLFILYFENTQTQENPPANVGDVRDVIPRFTPWARKIPWKRKWQPTPAFLPGKSYGQRSLEGLQSMGSQRVSHDFVQYPHSSDEDTEVKWFVQENVLVSNFFQHKNYHWQSNWIVEIFYSLLCLEILSSVCVVVFVIIHSVRNNSLNTVCVLLLRISNHVWVFHLSWQNLPHVMLILADLKAY